MSEYAECKKSIALGNFKVNKNNRGRVDLGNAYQINPIPLNILLAWAACLHWHRTKCPI